MAATEVVPGVVHADVGAGKRIFTGRAGRLYSHRYRAAGKRSQADELSKGDQANERSSRCL
jgi:hypothetical protein